MISSYRLGDLIFKHLNIQESVELLTEHPNSIGGKYILDQRKNNWCNNNFDIVTKFVLEHIEKHLDLLPKDITNSTVIHVRLGDVLLGDHHYEKTKRPLHINEIKQLLANDSNKKYIIGKCHFSKVSSTNYEECINASNEYLQNLINEIQGENIWIPEMLI